MSKKGRVLVAMSGGIDSCVTAALLKDAGYEVVGVTLKLGDTKINFDQHLAETTCCDLDDINDARSVAVNMNFPHYVIDLREEFEKYVINDYIDKTVEGMTPNPCIICNRMVKWGGLLKRADGMDCDYIATGHYARRNKKNGRYYISRPYDKTKDQTYFLWNLTQDQLARTMFPLANLSKEEVRVIALNMGFDDLVEKSESSDICFIPDDASMDFLIDRRPELAKLQGGNIITADGSKVGTHRGYPFYTVGQRRGLDVSLGHKVYVTEIRPDTNTLVVGDADDLESTTILIKDVNYQKLDRDNILNGGDYSAKIRSMDKISEAVICHSVVNDDLSIIFNNKVRAVAPGQSAVIYDGDDIVAGGLIRERVQ